jgi:hypothetical protein
MNDIYIYVAVSGIDPSDRNSLGHIRPNRHRHYKNVTTSSSSDAACHYALLVCGNAMLSPEWW